MITISGATNISGRVARSLPAIGLQSSSQLPKVSSIIPLTCRATSSLGKTLVGKRLTTLKLPRRNVSLAPLKPSHSLPRLFNTSSKLSNNGSYKYQNEKYQNQTPGSTSGPRNSSIEQEFDRLELEGALNATSSHAGKFNTIINICPQQEVWIVERLGKFYTKAEGGLHIFIPILDRIAYRFTMKEQALIIPSRAAITKDNVRIHCVGVLYYKIIDPVQAAYGCGDPVFALSQLAQTSLRSVIGKLTLDETFHERNLVNSRVVETCNDASKVWGIICLRHEIREIQPPENVLHAMEMQMSAERSKRVDILKSEGEQQATINRAEAKKRDVILQSEAHKAEEINRAEGVASAAIIEANAEKEALRLRAEGAAMALERIGKAVESAGGSDAVSYQLATRYLEAFSHMAKTNNTMIVPSDVANMSSMLAQATTVIQKVGANNPPTPKL